MYYGSCPKETDASADFSAKYKELCPKADATTTDKTTDTPVVKDGAATNMATVGALAAAAAALAF